MEKLRSREKMYPGFYNEIKITKQNNSAYKCRKQSRRLEPLQYKIQQIIIQNLTGIKSSTRRAKIEITPGIEKYLNAEYGIKKRFTACEKLLVDFGLVTRLAFKSCSANRNVYSYVSNFEIKINNKRFIKYQVEDNTGALIQKKWLKTPSIAIKFLRTSECLPTAQQAKSLKEFLERHIAGVEL